MISLLVSGGKGICWVVHPVGMNHHVDQFALWARLDMAAYR
jgi:hypothetical protein